MIVGGIIQTDSGASNAGVIEASKDNTVLCSGEIEVPFDTEVSNWANYK